MEVSPASTRTLGGTGYGTECSEPSYTIALRRSDPDFDTEHFGTDASVPCAISPADQGYVPRASIPPSSQSVNGSSHDVKPTIPSAEDLPGYDHESVQSELSEDLTIDESTQEIKPLILSVKRKRKKRKPEKKERKIKKEKREKKIKKEKKEKHKTKGGKAKLLKHSKASKPKASTSSPKKERVIDPSLVERDKMLAKELRLPNPDETLIPMRMIKLSKEILEGDVVDESAPPPYSATLRLQTNKESDVMAWKQAFCDVTGTDYILKRVSRCHAKRLLFSKVLVCQMSHIGKKRESNRATGCKAGLHLKIRIPSKIDDHRKDGYFAEIDVSWHHNHKLFDARAQSIMRVAPQMKEKVYNLFAQGISLGTVKQILRADVGESIVDGDSNQVVEKPKMHVAPSHAQVRWLFRQWKKHHSGGGSNATNGEGGEHSQDIVVELDRESRDAKIHLVHRLKSMLKALEAARRMEDPLIVAARQMHRNKPVWKKRNAELINMWCPQPPPVAPVPLASSTDTPPVALPPAGAVGPPLPKVPRPKPAVPRKRKSSPNKGGINNKIQITDTSQNGHMAPSLPEMPEISHTHNHHQNMNINMANINNMASNLSNVMPPNMDHHVSRIEPSNMSNIGAMYLARAPSFLQEVGHMAVHCSNFGPPPNIHYASANHMMNNQWLMQDNSLQRMKHFEHIDDRMRH